MRPVRIEVEGFSAYREHVEVDFEGVDFFSLAGPTGSGKSSLVDAMIFALYGRVPRLGGNAVAPVITAGTDRARVRFYFEVDDVVYDATRQAQRTPSGGASVKEARLQQGESVIADGPGDVTASVEELLRLGFEDFTRTVVLPQGDFARFLKATKSERQGLLRSLLGFDVYRTMRELARTRAAVATEQADGASRALDALDLADDETRGLAINRRDALESLESALPGLEEGLSALNAVVGEVTKKRDSLTGALERLQAIVEPPNLDEMESVANTARSRLIDVRERHEQANLEVERVVMRVEALPSSEKLSIWGKHRARLLELDQRLATDEMEDAKTRLLKAEQALEAAVTSLDEARRGAANARAEHAAHLLAGSLVVGDPCPVCSQAVSVLPDVKTVSVLVDAETVEIEAESEVARLREQAEAARTAHVGAEAAHAALLEQRAALIEELAEAPEDLSGLMDEQRSLIAELEQVRDASKRSAVDLADAEKGLEEIADSSRRVAKSLTQAQLSVADLDPPVPEADDVIVQWKELVSWRAEMTDRLMSERDELSRSLVEAERKATVAYQELTDLLGAHDVEAREPFAVQVATALQTTRGLVESHERAAQLSIDLAATIAEASARAAVAGGLADHLKANGFEQWLMAGAVGELVRGANDLLGQLSDGGYSLHSDESGSFSIVDHRNADEMRRVETLSGGETFLVSLALALSLAETLSAKGGSGLEAIVLDEGFGTLDDESLDTVASVLEELTGRGLMVGVITHVKELAARAPVRYEVRREPSGSKVRLVS